MKYYSAKELKENIKKGDYIDRLYFGDSVNSLKLLPENSVDLVVTSPPYDDLRDYENKLVWNFDVFKKIADLLYNVMKDGGVVVWVVGDKTDKGGKSLTSFKQAIYFQSIGFSMFDVIIYEKTGSGPPHPNRYFNTYEYMFVLYKGKKPKTINLLRDKKNLWAGCQTYGVITRREKDGSLTQKERKTINEYGVRTNIWRYTNGKGFAAKEKISHEHPAIFPEKLAQDHILAWSNEGDVVLDIFGGSGTTTKMSIVEKRHYLYFEGVEKYCEIAAKRLEEAFSDD